MALPTLLDLAKKNGSDATVGLIDEASRAYPEVSGLSNGNAIPNMGAARTIKGRSYKTFVRIALPVAGFRNANEGTTPVKGTYANRLVETFILNPRWECDKAVADGDEDGPESYITLEANAIMMAAMAALAKQFYYGRTTGDGKGHPGLVDTVFAGDSNGPSGATRPAMIVDATGTTANTGSSAWFVKFGAQNIQWVWGNNGELVMPDPRIETIRDSNNNPLTGYVQDLLAYPGVQQGSIYSTVRIKNLTGDSGKGLTDALLGTALSLFPVGWKPDVLLCSRREAEHLRKSRTATNVTGAPAPTPQEFQGIPIVITDSILDTEAIG